MEFSWSSSIRPRSSTLSSRILGVFAPSATTTERWLFGHLSWDSRPLRRPTVWPVRSPQHEASFVIPCSNASLRLCAPSPLEDEESSYADVPPPTVAPPMPIPTASTTYSSFVPSGYHPGNDLGVSGGLQGLSFSRIAPCRHCASPLGVLPSPSAHAASSLLERRNPHLQGVDPRESPLPPTKAGARSPHDLRHHSTPASPKRSPCTPMIQTRRNESRPPRERPAPRRRPPIVFPFQPKPSRSRVGAGSLQGLPPGSTSHRARRLCVLASLDLPMSTVVRPASRLDYLLTNRPSETLPFPAG